MKDGWSNYYRKLVSEKIPSRHLVNKGDGSFRTVLAFLKRAGVQLGARTPVSD